MEELEIGVEEAKLIYERESENERLTSLNLRNCEINSDSVKYIAGLTYLTSLTSLDLPFEGYSKDKGLFF